MRTYPARDLDTPPLLKGLLGSFWSELYGDQPELDAQLAALALPWRQAARDLDAAADSLAYETLPPLHVHEWHPVTLRERDRRNLDYVGLRYRQDADATYGRGYRYAEAAAPLGIPAAIGDVADAPLAFDSTYAPKVCLVGGLDYTLDRPNRLLWLRVDPFADPRWSPAPVLDAAGRQVDRELTLYLWHAGLDERLLYRRLGYAMGVDIPSSVRGRELLNAFVDALGRGTSRGGLERYLSALFDVPLCVDDGEVVEAVFEDAAGRCVATDRRAYRLSPAAGALVAPGDVLAAGQPLCDALRFDELHRGVIPAGLSGLVLQGAALDPALDGAYTFANADLPVTVLPSSPPQVRWPLGASPRQEDQFWDLVHARGLAAEKVLANYLDRRPDPTDDPGPASLPATINPLGFLLANLWRGSAMLARLRADAVGAGALSPKYLQLLRRIVPPHVLFLLEITLPRLDDDYLPDDDGVDPVDPTAAMPVVQDEPGAGWADDPAPEPIRPLPEYWP